MKIRPLQLTVLLTLFAAPAYSMVAPAPGSMVAPAPRSMVAPAPGSMVAPAPGSMVAPAPGVQTVPDDLVFHLSPFYAPSSFGPSVDGFADVNQDGYADFLVGAPLEHALGFFDGAVFVISGFDGSKMQELNGSGVDFSHFGESVSRAGDVDNDGFEDFIVGAPDHNSGMGTAFIFSGQTWALIRKHDGTVPQGGLGRVVSNIGDVDLDGFDDVLIGADGPTTSGAYVFSGQDGSTIHSFTVPSGLTDVDGAGDVDADGVPDAILGCGEVLVGFDSFAGRAYVYSGATGLLIHEYAGAAKGRLLGMGVAAVGDLDGDGHSEFLIGVPGLDDPVIGPSTGEARLYDGATGQIIRVHGGPVVYGEYGWHADGPGDITGDGLLDYLIGTRGYPYDAFAYSGTDGALVASYPDLGGYVAGVEDLTGDGVNDVLVGSALNAIVRVYGNVIPLVTDTGTISLSTGGTQNMRLIAAAHGLEDYLVIGSLQGTSPGYPLHSIVVPLNYDPVWGLFTVNNPNTGPLVDTYGQLDYWDQAFAGIQLPTGLDPSLVGLHLDHAFITLDATGTATFASNPVPLDLVP